MKSIISFSLLLIATAGTLAQKTTRDTSGCQTANDSSARDAEQIFIGESAKLGNGLVRSWMKLDAACNPLSIGVTFTEDALTGLPAELPDGQIGVEYHLDLPEQAAVTPFNHKRRPGASRYQAGAPRTSGL